jgi:hypothetical protein
MEKLALRWLKTLFDEGREVAIRLDANTKTGEVFAELTVEGMPKSPLAAEFARRPPTKNAFASLAGDDYAQRQFISAPLFADEVKEAAVKLIDYGQREAVKEAARGAPAEVVTLVEAAFKSFKATVESGEMDLAAALRGPNKEGFYTAVGAVHCKEGAQLEKAIRGVVKVLPENARGYFKFDGSKVGDVSVHEIDLSAEAGEPAKKIFGAGQKGYFAFTKDALYAAYGPEGMKLLKEAMAAKPAPAPVFDSSSNGKKYADIMKRLMGDENPNGARVRVGWMETMTTGMQLTVEGGDRLKVRFSLNVGAMLVMGFGVFAETAPGGAAPAVAPPVVAPPPSPPPPAQR